MKTIPFLFVFLSCTGCSLFSFEIKDIPRDHIVMINEDGELQDPAGNLDGEHAYLYDHETFSEPERTAHLERIIEQMLKGSATTAGPRRLMLYIHGGVGSEVGNLENAARIKKEIDADNASAGDSTIYPIFINWRSSLFKTYNDYLFQTRQGQRSRWNAWQSPFIFATDLVNGVLTAPVILYRSVEDILSQEDAAVKSRKNTVTGRAEPAGTPGRFALHQGDDRRGGWENTWLGMVYAFNLPIRIGTIPLGGVFGPGAWDNMRRNTTMVFNRPDDFETAEPIKSTGALTLFLDELVTALEASDDEWEITLIGHSMGTIVLNKILHRYPDLPIKNIVYMAAACSVQEYHDAVIGQLKLERRREQHAGEAGEADSRPSAIPKNREIQVYHLVLHDDAESEERFSPWFDVAHRGSLLVWLDNFITDPETLVDRTAGRFENLIRGLHLIPAEFRSQIHIKQFDYGSEAEALHPQKHAEFNQFTFWRPAFWAPHSKGVGYSKLQ